MSRTARTPDAAVRLVLTDLRRAASCITESVLVGRRSHKENLFAITFEGRGTRAKTFRRRLWLSVEIEVEAHADDVGYWRTHMLQYGYTVFGDERGSDEWFSYHHHPRSGLVVPHLHVNADADWAPKGLRRRHFPTGSVLLEDVVQMLIEDFGVVPRRTSWRTDLDRNRHAYI